MVSTLSGLNSNAIPPRYIVIGLWLIRVAAIWLLPTAFVCSILLFAFLSIPGTPFWNELGGRVVFGILIALTGLTSFAAPLTASVGVYLLTASAADGPEHSGLLSAQVLARVWTTSAIFLGFALLLTAELPSDQERALEGVIFTAFIPVLTLLATSLSIHIDRLATRFARKAPNRPGSIRTFTPQLTAAVGVAAFAIGLAMRVLWPGGDRLSDHLVPAFLLGFSAIIMIGVLITAMNDVNRLYRLVRQHDGGSRINFPPLDHAAHSGGTSPAP